LARPIVCIRHHYVTNIHYHNINIAKHWDNKTTFKAIDEIAKNPILYDSNCVGYTNRDARRTICDEIGKMMDASGT
jgi:hypothetical protein